jgi:ABC-type dipeptide/oligopeptide/nickel transport system permease component
LLGRYLFRRVVALVPTLLGALTVIFMVVHLIPGDPVLVILGENFTQAAYDATQHRLGLDQPLLTQYVTYMGEIATGNFGDSFRTKRSIIDDIASQFPYTLELALASLLMSLVIGIPSGMIAALYRNRLPDQICTVFALLGVCTPGFWLGVMLIYFLSLQLDLLPSIGAASLDDPVKMIQTLILPSITLGAANAALIARISRSALLDVLGQDYIRTARAKGLSATKVVVRHALKNGLIPVVTVVTLELGQLLAGSAIIEIVFSRPGLGHLLIDAVLNRDYPQVQATLVFFVLMVSLTSLIGDLLYPLIDPRVGYD